MIFFGKDEKTIYSSMQNRADGCFPISDEGVWHAGIHIYFDKKTVIKNPISGRIVTCSFDEKKDWNYIILENDIIFPENKGQGRIGYHCFNLISNLDSKMPYDDLLNKSFKLNDETLCKLSNIPFYIQLKTTLPTSNVIEGNFKKVNVPVNQRFLIERNNLTGEEVVELTNLKNYGLLKKGAPIKYGNIIIGEANKDVTVKILDEENFSMLFELNDFSTNIRGNCIKLSDDIPKGFFVINQNTPNKYGNIELKNKKNFNLWIETKESKNKSTYPEFGLIVRNRSDEYKYILNLLDENRQKEFSNLLNSIDERNGIVFVVQEDQKDKIFPFLSDECKLDYSYKITDKKGNIVTPFFLTANEYEKKFAIKNNEYGINFNNILQKARDLWENERLMYTKMQRIDISSTYNALFNGVKLADDKGIFFDENHLYNSKSSRFISDLYAIAKPYLYSWTEYRLKVSANDVYHEKMIVYNSNEICLFKNTNTQNGYPCGDKIQNIKGEVIILNTADYISSIKSQPNYIWIKTERGYIYLSKYNYSRLSYSIKKKDLNTGDEVNSGEILGCPALLEESIENKYQDSKPYIDYALFFTEDITKLNTTLENVNIEEGTDCIIEKVHYLETGNSIFLPPGVSLATEAINDEYKRIKEATCTIYVYADQVLNKKLKNDAFKFFIPNTQCKILLKNGLFDSVSPSINNETDIILIVDFTNSFVSKMKGIVLNGPVTVKDGTCYTYTFKFDVNAIVKNDIDNNGKMQFIKTYYESKEYEKTKTPKAYKGRYIFSKEKEVVIDGKIFYPLIIEGNLYNILKKDIEKTKENVIKDFREECETVNFGKKPITSNKICPDDKLFIDNINKKNIVEFKKALRTRLKEKAPDFIEYVHSNNVETGYNIYNNENNQDFYKLLSEYLRKTISVHPLEWDFKLLKDVCKTRGKPPVDENKNTDIFAALKKAGNQFSHNRFYFVCPVNFYNRMEELGLLFNNPYQGVKEHSRLGGKRDPEYEFKINPGFAPFCENEKGLHGKFEHEYVINNKTLYFAALNNPYGFSNGYYDKTVFHTGIDFPGTNDLNVPNAPIMSFVKGRIWACTTGNGRLIDSDKDGSYGRCMIIKGDNNYLYLLGHLQSFAGHKLGDYISVGEIVAYAGNTGNSDIAHLHLEIFDCDIGMDEDARKSVLDISCNKPHEIDGGEKGSKKAYLKFSEEKSSFWKRKDLANTFKNYRLNPLTGEKE